MLLKRMEQHMQVNPLEALLMLLAGVYASKNMTSGEGGVITTNSDEIDETLRMIRTHGEKAKYSSVILGTNYRMSEMRRPLVTYRWKSYPLFWLNAVKTHNN